MSGIVSNALSADVFNTLVNETLDFYVKNKLFKQNIDDRPTFAKMKEAQKTFPGGPEIKLNVKGNYAANGDWLGNDGPVNFRTVTGTNQASFPWYTMHDGIEIGYTALKAAGFSVSDKGSISEHGGVDMIRITNFLETIYSDLDESLPMSIQSMLWRDGSADPDASPGIPAFISTTPTTGSVGGISRSANSFWRNRALVGASQISYSAANQTLTHTMEEEIIQLRRKGGRPNYAPAGSKFIKALKVEAYAKGILTQTGFGETKKTRLGVGPLGVMGIDEFTYEPMLDELGLSDYCYLIDTTKLYPMVMEGEEFKIHMPARPHDIFKFFKSITWTGTLVATQLNCHGVYQVDDTGL